jgi:phosphoglycolate phosphatase
MASTGGRGMLKIGFNLKPQDTHYEQLLPQFFDAYEAQQNHNSHFFEDIQTVLKEIESLAITWGIVTNKAHRFFDPLPQQKPLLAKAGVVICGDTTPYRKPHPAPLLTAAKRLQVMPEACWYVGDDKRDIEAAKAAGMYAIAAHWGYLGEHPVESWQPDVVLEEPIQLLSLLKEAV